MTYEEFLYTKIEIAKDSGIEINREEISDSLKPHQKDAVWWALKGGRRALFEAFGLGKTIQELEFCRLAVYFFVLFYIIKPIVFHIYIVKSILFYFIYTWN
jgi:hypothetical protein